MTQIKSLLMIRSVFEWRNLVMPVFPIHLNYYLNHVLKMENFLLNGKKQMRFLHVKKEISKYWKITVPYLCFPLPEKYLKEYCIMNVLELFLKNDLISHSQPGRKPGDSCINQLLLITLKYINNLTMVLMFVVYF